MTASRSGSAPGALPLALASGVVVLLVVGLARGVWPGNLHNGLLAASFTGVGCHLLVARPANRTGRLFLAAGCVEAVVFCGRQVGHAPLPGESRWWGWFGVWPVALSVGLVTLAVLCFPDGRLPGRRWRPVAVAVAVVAVLCSALSALWPVEYGATGIATGHPLALPGEDVAGAVWGALAHPAYAVMQLLWVVALVLRWRTAGPVVRAQLAWVALAAGASGVLLVVGLLAAGSPLAGLLGTALVPVAAGWAVVHGRHLATSTALGWLTRAGPSPADLPRHLVRAAGEALSARRVTLWSGPSDRAVPVATWPDGDPVGPEQPGAVLAPVQRDGTGAGALVLDRAGDEPLEPAEEALLADLTAQAGLVLGHLALLRAAPDPGDPSSLSALTPRERDVLALVARGLSNAAICAELHLSIKTVEPLVGSVFAKLGLDAGPDTNRRVLAARAYLGADLSPSAGRGPSSSGSTASGSARRPPSAGPGPGAASRRT